MDKFRSDSFIQKEELFLLKILQENGGGNQVLRREAAALQLDWKMYRLLLLKTLTNHGLSTSQLTSMKQKTTSALESHKAVVFSHEHHIGILINERLKNEESKHCLLNTLHDISSNNKMVCSMSQVYTDLTELKAAYKETRFLLDRQFFYCPVPILFKESKLLFGKSEEKDGDMT